VADVTHGHPARIQADDNVRQAAETAFTLGHQHRRERARPVPRDVQLDRADLGLHRLRRRTVPRIAGAFPSRVVLVIAQMLTELGLQPAFQDRLAQLGQETTRPRKPAAVGTDLGHHLIQHLLAQQRFHRRRRQAGQPVGQR
jgi:hypothetical protein